MSGYTLSYRDKWTHPVFRNLREAGMWSWICDSAAWKKTKVRFNGIMVELDRGQLATSIRFMSSGFEVGEQLTRTFLQNLEKEGMINTRPTHWGTIITVCNYDKYQSLENADNTPVNTRPTHGQHTGNTNKNKYNTSNEDNTYTDDFNSFWSEYPKRKGSNPRKTAYAKYASARKSNVDAETILSAVKKYAAFCRSEGIEKTAYVAQASTWLSQERWNDELFPQNNRRPNGFAGM